jgi:tetratricopeptide (TPR) repeat protein
MAQLLFLMGDSYRKSAALLREAMAAKERTAAEEAAKVAQAAAAAPDEGEPAADKDLEAKVARAALEKSEAESEIKQRLNRAAQLYAAVVERFYKKAPDNEQDKLYLKLSYFYRADCMYDLGDYQGAIKLYDTAAVRYQDDPSALAAYVQIVNSWIKLGNLGEAKTANERAKWLLRKMPNASFESAGPVGNKQYWEQWLRWANDAGMFGPGPAIVGGQEPPPGQ